MSAIQKTIPIDWDYVDELLHAGCTGTQIAANLGIHPDSLYNRCKTHKKCVFSAYRAEKRAKGQSYVLHKQFEKALTGDNTMLVWVGKQQLGQQENPSVAEEFNGKLGELLDLLKSRESAPPKEPETT